MVRSAISSSEIPLVRLNLDRSSVRASIDLTGAGAPSFWDAISPTQPQPSLSASLCLSDNHNPLKKCVERGKSLRIVNDVYLKGLVAPTLALERLWGVGGKKSFTVFRHRKLQRCSDVLPTTYNPQPPLSPRSTTTAIRLQNNGSFTPKQPFSCFVLQIDQTNLGSLSYDG